MKKLRIHFLVLLTVWLHPKRVEAQYQNGLSQAYLQGSLDVAKQILTGPSYEDFKANYNTYGFNVGLYFNPFRASEELRDDYHLPDRSLRNSPLNSATLLASIDRKPGPMVPDPKASSSFLRHLSPLVGIQLIGKGGKYSDRFGTSITHMTYLEIPIYAIYTYMLPEDKGRLFGGLGFYVAYGLWGTLKFDDPRGTESFSAFDKFNGYKRFDAGLNFMAGYELPQRLRLSIVHELGVTSIDPVAGSDKTRNSVWSLNVGYPLKKLVALTRKK
ncbi:porin family protein [Spirosoma areae]